MVQLRHTIDQLVEFEHKNYGYTPLTESLAAL